MYISDLYDDDLEISIKVMLCIGVVGRWAGSLVGKGWPWSLFCSVSTRPQPRNLVSHFLPLKDASDGAVLLIQDVIESSIDFNQISSQNAM